MQIIKEWEVTVSITRTINLPVEDNEKKEDVIKWAKTEQGKRYIQTDFLKNLNCYSIVNNGDIHIDEIELKESEPKKSDTHPLV